MRKNIFKTILCVVFAAALSVTATGCALFEHNNEKDYAQVVAIVAPVEATYTVENEDGSKGETLTFKSEEKKIYKTQLINVWNSNAANLINSGYTPEDAANYLLDQLVQREQLLNEADKMIAFGLLKWNQNDKNEIMKSVYSSIDSLVKSISDGVLEDHDEPTVDSGSSSDTGSTTYPVPEVEEEEEEEDENPEVWKPDPSSYLAISGDDDRNSRERETVRRLVDTLENYADSDIIATETQKKYFENDIKKLRALIADYREEDIYAMLYDPDYNPETGEGNGTYIVEYLWGRSARESRKLTRLQDYATDGVNVSKEEVVGRYNSLLATQKSSYTDASTYKTAMSSDTENVVYTPDDNWFYVKHILIPFSDEQTAQLKAFKNNPLHSKNQITQYRAQLAKEIKSYPHVNGENDLSREMSIDAIYAAVMSKMSPLVNTPRDAERMFDSLVYEYNTDPGAFGSVKGYAIQRELPAGETETYMQEFVDAARDMYENLQVGQVYPEKVITDYGVHIMYLASKTVAGAQKGLTEYQTPAEYKTVEQVIRDTLQSSKETAAYEEFCRKVIARYEDDENAVTKYTKRFKELYTL